MQLLWTGFGLVTGFIVHLQMVSTSNYNALANSCTCLPTTAYTKSFQSDVSSAVVARQRFSTADVPLTMGSRTIPVPKLPASNSNDFQRLNLSSSLTQQPTT
jgi:hypothetical protein